jgi:hypothetical protein
VDGAGAAQWGHLLERSETWVFTVEEGLIRRVVEFTTMEEALEAVGLSE